MIPIVPAQAVNAVQAYPNGMVGPEGPVAHARLFLAKNQQTYFFLEQILEKGQPFTIPPFQPQKAVLSIPISVSQPKASAPDEAVCLAGDYEVEWKEEKTEDRTVVKAKMPSKK